MFNLLIYRGNDFAFAKFPHLFCLHRWNNNVIWNGKFRIWQEHTRLLIVTIRQTLQTSSVGVAIVIVSRIIRIGDYLNWTWKTMLKLRCRNDFVNTPIRCKLPLLTNEVAINECCLASRLWSDCVLLACWRRTPPKYHTHDIVFEYTCTRHDAFYGQM